MSTPEINHIPTKDAMQKSAQELETAKETLQNSNNMYKELLDHIMSLYQIVDTFGLDNNLESLCNTFAYYASKLTKSHLAFVWKRSDKEGGGGIWIYSNPMVDIEDNLAIHIAKQWRSIRSKDKPILLSFEGSKYLVISIKSSSRYYGLIGILVDRDSQYDELYQKQLSFLSSLLARRLEGQQLRELDNQLMIIEEQNRIANEIHDSVSQRLFSIVCGITAISKKYNNKQDIQDDFQIIRQEAYLAISELQSSIYSLSSRKKGEKPFVHMIKEYLENFALLHSIKISYSVTGDEELISINLKRALYRIIREGTANAVQHGKCRNIRLVLKLELPNIVLSLEDDGQGFNVNDLQTINGSGLGLWNMRNLVLSFNGHIDIDSQASRNTRILISIPTNRQYNDVEGAAI